MKYISQLNKQKEIMSGLFEKKRYTIKNTEKADGREKKY
jgi:hypothetical protein